MKKLLRITAVITLLTVLFAVFHITPIAANEIRVTVDGVAVDFADQAPASISGRTLVPLRAVFQHMGFTVTWQSPVAVLMRGSDTIVISLNSYYFFTNGQVHTLEVPAQNIGGRIMLPIRAVVESIGYGVRWDSASNTVQISSNPANMPQRDDVMPGAGEPAISAEPSRPTHPNEPPPPNEPAPPTEPSPPAEPPVVATLPTIPNRRLTDTEITDWIHAYDALGGANDFELEVLRLVNAERAAAGLAPLTLYNPLMMAARFKAQSMSNLGYFSHTSPVYGNFANISREIFGVPQRAMAENIANGQRTPEAVMNSWMNSEGHRRNILNSTYTRIGIGFYNGRWVQKFTS